MRAYSQNIFNPKEILSRNPSEDGFVNEVAEIVGGFIRDKVAGDGDFIRREVRSVYATANGFKMSQKARSSKKNTTSHSV